MDRWLLLQLWDRAWAEGARGEGLRGAINVVVLAVAEGRTDAALRYAGSRWLWEFTGHWWVPGFYFCP